MTEADVSEQMARLANAFSRPFGAKARGQVAEYHGALAGDRVRADELKLAVDLVIKEADKFPAVRVLRAAVASIRTQRRLDAGYSPRPEELTPTCLQCRSEFFWAGYEMPNGLVLPRRRCRCKASGSGWDTPRAKAWTETDRTEVARHGNGARP